MSEQTRHQHEDRRDHEEPFGRDVASLHDDELEVPIVDKRLNEQSINVTAQVFTHLGGLLGHAGLWLRQEQERQQRGQLSAEQAEKRKKSKNNIVAKLREIEVETATLPTNNAQQTAAKIKLLRHLAKAEAYLDACDPDDKAAALLEKARDLMDNWPPTGGIVPDDYAQEERFIIEEALALATIVSVKTKADKLGADSLNEWRVKLKRSGGKLKFYFEHNGVEFPIGPTNGIHNTWTEQDQDRFRDDLQTKFRACEYPPKEFGDKIRAFGEKKP